MNTFLSRICLTLVAAACAASVAPAASANQLVNGSFELGVNNWIPGGNWGITNQHHTDLGQAWLSVGNGTLQQTFSSVAGTEYSIEFDYWGFGDFLTHTLLVGVAGSSPLLSQTLTVTGTGSSFTHKTFTGTFIADSNSATLKFTDQTGRNIETGLDRISVNAVPEPQSVVLMAVGMTCIGVVGRRRRLSSAEG